MRHWAEEIAKTYLEGKGYQTLAENYTMRGGEIDLILRDRETIVFAEVRQRKTDAYGSAAASISAAKLARLQRTALHYLVATVGRDDVPLRFDAVLLTGVRENYRLEHLENILF